MSESTMTSIISREHQDKPHPREEELSGEEQKPDYPKLLTKYRNDMYEIITRYNYKSPENPGNIAKKVRFKDKDYTLIEESHSAVCDNPICQQMFQYQDNLETGLSAFYYPMLPIYTHNMEGEYCALCIGL